MGDRHQPHDFASDNHAGVHPDVMAAVMAANEGHAPAYGADDWTAGAVAAVRGHLGPDVAVVPVLNGTGANVLAVAALTRPYHAVICAETAHLNVDECGAPERLTGCKLLDVPTADGKLTPALVEDQITGVGVEHHVQPRLVSIAQTTEYGTVYTPAEIRHLAATAHAHGLLLHVDGSRLAIAAASLDVPLSALTTEAGVDVLSLGGTKAGAMGAEALVFRDAGLAAEVPFLRKSLMQHGSKLRFVSAQLEALYAGDLALRLAAHANAMARRLADAVAGVPAVELTQPVQANAIFAVLPPDRVTALQEVSAFHVWDARRSEVRWMTSWDTTPEDVDRFAARVAEPVPA